MHPSFLSSSHKLVEHAIGGFSLVSGFFSGVGCLCLGLITLNYDPCNAVVFMSVCVCVCVCVCVQHDDRHEESRVGGVCVCVCVCGCVFVCVEFQHSGERMCARG